MNTKKLKTKIRGIWNTFRFRYYILMMDSTISKTSKEHKKYKSKFDNLADKEMRQNGFR